jgi:GT2 family glycosyltransferase
MLTIAIPTYERGTVLCETISLLLRVEDPADEILIVDQTPRHPQPVCSQLESWVNDGTIRHLRLETPSITRAMNTALREARSPLVLFLDDDIIPSPELLRAHRTVHRDPNVWAVVGQVLQPGEKPQTFPETDLRKGVIRDLEFRFNSDVALDVQNVMAGNLSVKTERALEVGGFDENYIAVAYRFETDFALRLARAGGRIRFEPSASIRHLKASGGGVRTWGDHRTSPSPMHSVGDYYFARHNVEQFWAYVARRLLRNVATRYHLRHPWTIPSKLTGEMRGLALALLLSRDGRRLLE